MTAGPMNLRPKGKDDKVADTSAEVDPSKLLLDMGNGLELWSVSLTEVIEQDVNARAMDNATFLRLTETIKRDKRLEALPLCAKTPRGIEIVSGHHRTRAARSAGLTHVYALVDASGLTRDQIAAKQLAHNAIVGHDNDDLIRQIYAQIEDVNARLESFIDPAIGQKKLDTVAVDVADVTFDFRVVVLTFLPHQEARLRAVLDNITAMIPEGANTVLAVDMSVFDVFKAAVNAIESEYDVRSASTAVAQMAEIAMNALGLPVDSRPGAVVPIRDIFKSGVIPADAAKVIQDGLAAMLKDKAITEKALWRAIELWAADYLAQ